MRTIYILGILVLLAVAVPASPAHAGDVVMVCDEAHLRAALAGGGTVTFACSGVITLSSTITIEADTMIDGNGQEVIISGNNAVRVFWVDWGVTLNLLGLVVANGNAFDGGGIFNDHGTVAIINSVFCHNRATQAGGAIMNEGVYSPGTVTISNSIFSDNWAGRAGVLYNSDGTITVNNSVFSGNGTEVIFNNNGTMVVGNSTFSDNSGGVIGNFGTVMVSNSTFSNNSAVGGGVLSNGADMIVRNSTFFGNSASEYGGAIVSGRTLTVSNSTFSGNRTDRDGGSIYNVVGVATVSNSTFSGNSALGDGDSIYNHASGTITLKNTIIAAQPKEGNCFGTIIDGGGNLSYPDTTCPGINADPMLGPLQDNGGLTWTMALGEGSAALDAADDAICAAPPVNNLDQRGVTRPQGLHCDIGAVEQVFIKSVWLPAVQVW